MQFTLVEYIYITVGFFLSIVLLIGISETIILTTESVIAFSYINSVLHLFEFFLNRLL